MTLEEMLGLTGQDIQALAQRWVPHDTEIILFQTDLWNLITRTIERLISTAEATRKVE